LSHLPDNVQTLLNHIRENWNHVLSDEIVHESKLMLLFDTYLHKVHGYSPGRTRISQARQWQYLDGYNREPASLLPQLHHFLPACQVTIEDGAVAWDDFHYEHPFLTYWHGSPATIYISHEAESRCWVYLEGNVLCEARARELRLLDGSYRDNRR
jgi:hypothetical protein